MIHPVKIFKDEHEGDILSDDLERFAELAHHALACGPLDLALQRGLLVRSYKRWKLDQPSWRVCSQCVGHERPPLAAGQLSETFENGIVRLLASEAFN